MDVQRQRHGRRAAPWGVIVVLRGFFFFFFFFERV